MRKIIGLLSVLAMAWFLVGFIAAAVGLVSMLVVFGAMRIGGIGREDLEVARIVIKAYAFNASMRRSRGDRLTHTEELVVGWARPTFLSWRPERLQLELFMRSVPNWRDVTIEV